MIKNATTPEVKFVMKAGNFADLNQAVRKFVECSTDQTGKTDYITAKITITKEIQEVVIAGIIEEISEETLEIITGTVEITTTMAITMDIFSADTAILTMASITVKMYKVPDKILMYKTTEDRTIIATSDALTHRIVRKTPQSL